MLELILVPVLMSGAAILAHRNQRAVERPCILAPNPARDEEPATFTDSLFAEEAVKGAIFGLLLGTLAIEKSSNPEIRKLAERVVQCSQTIILDLTAMAERKGIEVAKIMDLCQQRTLQLLSGLSGEAFDIRFVDEASAEHQKKLKMFYREVESGTDREFKRFAWNILPKVKSLLSAATHRTKKEKSFSDIDLAS